MFDCYDTLITPEEVADMLGCGMYTPQLGAPCRMVKDPGGATEQAE